MEFKAELVLHDCTIALSRHTEDLQGTEFRLSWWTIISLLRAVGHVLDKVDKPNLSSDYRIIIEDKYRKLKQSKPQPYIYWSFIEDARNKFLKE